MSIGRSGIKNLAYIKNDEFDDLDKSNLNNNNDVSKIKYDELSLNNLPVKKDEPAEEPNELYRGNKITAKGYILILGLSSTVFAACCAYSLVAPFFPRTAERKGLTIAKYSYIFSVYEVASVILPPFCSRLAIRMTPKIFLMACIFIFASCSMIFGFLDYANDGDEFFYLCLIVRVFWSVGGAGATTAVYLVGTLLFPNHIPTIYASVEIGAGAGFMLGPFFGAYLFELGGFSVPFIATTILSLLTIIPVHFLIHNEVKPKSKEDAEKPTSFLQLLKVPGVAINLLASSTTCFCIGFNESTLDHHLREIGDFTPVQVGRVFLITGSIYSVLTYFYGYVAKKYEKNSYYMIFIGLILITCSFVLVGPLPFLPFNSSLGFVLASQGCFGVGMGALFVCAFDETVKEAKKYLPNNESTMAGVSALFTSSYSAGTAIGPLIGGQLISRYGYRIATIPMLCTMLTLTLIIIIYITKIKKDVNVVNLNGISAVSRSVS